MASKSKAEKKKRAKTKKREKELLRQKVNHKAVTPEPEEQLGNGGEPLPAPINEDAEIPMQTLEENVKEMEAKEAAIKEMAEAADLGLKRVEEMDIEKPFDPMSVVANILKKKDG